MTFFALLSSIAAKIFAGFLILTAPLVVTSIPTPFLQEQAPPPQGTVQTIEPQTETPASSTLPATPIPAKQEEHPPEGPVAMPPVVETPPLEMPVAEEPAPILPSDINARTRDALVNILCTGSGGPLRPASGSGILIDPRGVILTNAHVAQYFLLKDYPAEGTIECTIRVGSPARSMYTAELLYMPPAWVAANAHKIAQQSPTGTGEHDYALLRITGRTDPAASLPPSFPYVAPVITDVTSGTPVLLAGYAAGFLDGATIQTNLYASSARTETGDLFTFDPGGDTDLFSIGGTILSQRGSSGGAVVRERDERLLGVIVTATIGETTADRDLRAISSSHIDESVRTQTGAGLGALLEGDLQAKARIFNITTAPSLTQALVEVIER